MSDADGVLYVVATPIGNLADMGRRALQVLAGVDRILAEDTRQTAVLLREYGIDTPLSAYHEHNEEREAPKLAEQVAAGRRLALVSDAGTPLVSDPGYRLVHEVRARGLRVVPVPGPAALIAALSASGLPSDRFLFAGFPPRTSERRLAFFRALSAEPGTLIFYESSHRVAASLEDLCEVFGSGRRAVLARELTKLHETFLQGSACDLARVLAEEPVQSKGEHVLLVQGAGQAGAEAEVEGERVLRVLLQELPVKQAAALAARISGAKKNALYRLALGKS
jgi:16S rRNA (cytidine1402-2'-O)-methyltransferase